MNQTALVVGAAGGVGTEVVRQLLDAGYSVIATVLNAEEEKHLNASAPGVETVLHLDLTDADGVLITLRQQLAAIDAVVVCAAISPYGPLEIASLAELRRTLEVNTVSDIAIFQATMPLLRASKGRIVFISSFAGKVGLPMLGHYVASKHALEGMGDVMRREARSSGVSVILIEPGGIRTPMVTGQRDNIDRTRAALSADDAALFGGMYDSFSALLKNAWSNAIEPSMVAQTIVSALTADDPAARYQVGEDAKFLCDMARKSDPEIDATVSAFWGG